MTREEAIKIVKEFINDTCVDREALETLIPELKESEDERIRKEIIEHLTPAPYMDNPQVQKQKEWIAWLEKQKEQPISAEGVLVKAGLKPYKDGNQWCILAGNNIQEGICGFGDTIDEALYQFLKEVLDLQKEQKPVEWSKDDEAHLKWLCGIIRNVRLHGGLSLKEESELVKWIDKWINHEPQPKNEWSEEDEKKRNLLIDILEVNHPNGYFKVNPANTLNMEAIHVEELVDWLKSLRPQPRKEIYQAAKHDLAIRFMNYLDENRPEGKMSLSNGECGDIDKAFKENDWIKIIGYAKKYQILQEQKPETKLTGWVARDRNGEIYVYGDYPEKDSERPIWIGSNSIILDQESFPNIKWETEPVEVEITIKRK